MNDGIIVTGGMKIDKSIGNQRKIKTVLWKI